MPSFLSELTHRASGALVVAVLAVGVAPAAHAAAVSGQGTWETTLQGRDLDGNAATFEAYYDTALNITWLADANYAKTSRYDADGDMNWDAAKTWAAKLNINGTTGWRLPDVKPVNGSSFQYEYGNSFDGTKDVGFNITSPQSELAHLYHVTLGNKSYYDTSGNGPQLGWGLTGPTNSGPFSNVQSGLYWSGVEYAPDTSLAWSFDTHGGGQYNFSKNVEFSVWAVRPGDVAAVLPEPSTYALMGLGLAAVWVARRRRA